MGVSATWIQLGKVSCLGMAALSFGVSGFPLPQNQSATGVSSSVSKYSNSEDDRGFPLAHNQVGIVADNFGLGVALANSGDSKTSS